jgi:hypothetical protein
MGNVIGVSLQANRTAECLSFGMCFHQNEYYFKEERGEQKVSEIQDHPFFDTSPAINDQFHTLIIMNFPDSNIVRPNADFVWKKTSFDPQ